MLEIQACLLPYKRYNSLSYSESFCWKSFLEFFTENDYGISCFERCMADAGRNYGGRLLTVPVHPQVSSHVLLQRSFAHTNFSHVFSLLVPCNKLNSSQEVFLKNLTIRYLCQVLLRMMKTDTCRLYHLI